VLWQTSVDASAYEARDTLLSTELDNRKVVSLAIGQSFFRGQWDDQAYAEDLRIGWPVRQSRWNLLLRDTLGHLDLKGNALSYQADQSVNGPHENGVYDKLNVAAGGSWQLVPAWPVALDLSVHGQVAFHNLDVLEQDSIGGITGVRAYAYADPVGDQSAVGSVALRAAPASNLWLTTYFDEGWVETSYRRYGPPSPIPNSYRLAAAGVRLNWMPWRGAMLSGTFAASIPVEALPVALTQPMETHPDGKRGWVGFTQSF
jgi:hemolysin activation/secretion protein